jgi:riboflavin biosynthesis pyrimidine reductase
MPADWHSRVLVAGNEQWDPTLALAQLFERGMNRVLCEGGPQLATLLLERDLVDDYCLTTSPHPGGAHAAAVPPLPARMARSHRLEGQGFSMERGVRRR